MNIGIFGDSFAERMIPELNLAKQKLSEKDYYEVKANIKARSFSYHDYIQSRGFSYGDHGMGGSDIYYSYLQFLENQEKYDRVVFFVTGMHRISLKVQDGVWMHLTNSSDLVKKFARYVPTKSLIYANSYANSAHRIDETRYKTFANLMLEDIRRIRPDTIFITAIHEDWDSTDSLERVFTWTTSVIDKNSVTTGSWYGSNFVDYRICHLTKPDHLLLGKKIVDALEKNDTEVEIRLQDFQRDIQDWEKDYYILEVRKNIKRVNKSYFIDRDKFVDKL